jgi:hypothetical protein
MAGLKWAEAEVQWFYAHPKGTYWEFVNDFGSTRTFNAWRVKRGDLYLGRDGDPLPTVTDNSRESGGVSWREWNEPIKAMQALRKRAKGSLQGEDAAITMATDAPVAFVVLGDSHIGAWSTDHELWERITDEILGIPNLYVALVGDMAHAAIKLRGVTEVEDNLLPIGMQAEYTCSWLLEMQDRILFATWGNHEVERAEAQAGLNPFGDLYKKNARHYFNGIGHLTLRINAIDYKIAASHHYMGRSIYNPCHGAQRYLERVGIDRDLAVAGDSHVPGVLKFTHGPMTKLAINCGSAQTMSGYAQRYFSLVTHPVYPVVVLDHERKDFWAHWSIAEYLRCSGQKAA